VNLEQAKDDAWLGRASPDFRVNNYRCCRQERVLTSGVGVLLCRGGGGTGGIKFSGQPNVMFATGKIGHVSGNKGIVS